MIRRPPYCNRCGAEITWSVTEAGKRMPVDRTTSSDGTIVYNPDGSVHVLTKDETPADGVPRFKAHFATCTNGK